MEFGILDWIQENMRSDMMDQIMSGISFPGNAGMIWIALAVMLIAWKKHRSCGLTLAVGLIASGVIGNLFLKNVVARPRPCWINQSVELAIASPLDYSFPSGHTLVSFIAATILFNYNKAVGAAAYVLAVLIAFSRLYLYVHFPTDVLAGIILGIAIGLAVSVLMNRLMNRMMNKSAE